MRKLTAIVLLLPPLLLGCARHGEPVDSADRLLARQLSHRLHQDASLWREGRVQVDSRDGVVLLTGELPTPALRARAEAHALGLRDARAYYNDIRIGAARSPTVAQSDRLLRELILASLRGSQRPAPGAYEIVVAQGTVYVLGRLTPAEFDFVRQHALDAGALAVRPRLPPPPEA